MGGSVGKIAKIALPIAAVAAPFAAPALMGAGTTAALAGMSTFGPATAAAVAGSSVAGAAGMALSGFGAAGGIMGTIGQVGSAISSIANVAGSFGQPMSTYQGALSTAYQAKQASVDYLTAAENFEFQSGVSLQNADIAERNRIFEEQINFAVTERMIRSNRKAIRSGQTAYAASGVTQTGSVQDVLGDMATEGALNVALQEFESRHRQKGYEIQREAAIKESQQYKKAAERSKENAKTVLEEGLKASKYQKYTSYAQGVEAIPKVIDSVSTVLKLFE